MFTTSRHRLYCCLLKVSQYQLAVIDTASVHIVKGISQHIHNRAHTAVLLLVVAVGSLGHYEYCQLLWYPLSPVAAL